MFQTRLDCGSLSVYKHQFLALSFQTCPECGSLFAYTHQYPALCLKHVWIMFPVSVYISSLQPFVSNTFDFGFLFVYSIVSNTFGLWILVCVQASVLSQNGYGWYCLHGSDVNFVFPHVMSGLDYEGGDGHKHGCLDALAITLSLRWSSQESCNERIFLFCFCIASMY